MALNWAPTYEDGTPILVSDIAYKDSWLMDRFSAEKLIDRPWLIRTMSVRMCELWLEAYNMKSILPKARAKDPSISIRETKLLVRARMTLVKKTRAAFDVGKRKRVLLSQYCDELNNLAARVEAQPQNRQLEIDVHGSKNRNTLYDFAEVVTGLYSEAAYRALLVNPKTKTTFEHFFPRTAFATRLAEMVVDNRLADTNYRMTEKDMLPSVYTAAFVSITLPEENQMLIAHQGSKDFTSPAETYKNAGIKIVVTDHIKVHHSWNHLANVFDVTLVEPTLHDFDYDGVGEYVHAIEVSVVK